MALNIGVTTDQREDGTWARANFLCREIAGETATLKREVNVEVQFDGNQAVVVVNDRVVCGIDDEGMTMG